MITIPKNTEIHDEPGGKWWIDEHGILYSIGKKDAPKPTKEETEKNRQRFKEIFGEKKICMMLDITYAQPTTKKERDEAAPQMGKMVKAIALLTTSPLSRMMANLFFGLKPPPYPAKIFTNEKEAKEWLKQYL